MSNDPQQLNAQYAEQKSLSFIESLGEARMFKSKQQISSEGARSITDHVFVSMMSLYAMSQDYNHAPVAADYAKRTISRGGFNQASPSGTDLYQTLFTLKKPGEFLTNEKDKLLLNKVKLNDTKIKQFLKKIETGSINQGEAQAFLFKLERDLMITDPKLRAARRLTANWTNISTEQRTLVASQLNRYYRVDARRSDMYPLFSKFAKTSGVAGGKIGKIGKRVARGAAAFAAGYAAGKFTEL